jgi:MerR family transcriptional regulator/heat shock protein HspR
MANESTGLLTISQAAELLGVHANTLRGWADKGLIDHVKLPSGYRRFSRDEVDRLREEMGLERVEGKAAA